MKLVVISPEADDPRELDVLAALMAAGLERYHVRKPHWSRERLAAWLAAVPEVWRCRLVLHQHHDLAGPFGCAGVHSKDGAPDPAPVPGLFRSRACHDLASLEAALGRCDAVLCSPVFPSISKAGYEPSADFRALAERLARRTAAERRTEVIALGGITPERVARCAEFGFDGVAVLGALWQADDPPRVFAALQQARPVGSAALRSRPVLCITQDGIALSHEEQAERLCRAGARWIQLRMKRADAAERLRTAKAVVAICRAHGALCVVNDSVELALAADADGAHLGQSDGDWAEARRRLGAGRLLGGTVNDAADAARAVACGCLDYAGVGPWRFTTTKANLSPVLGADGVRALLTALGGLPAWVIGGIEPVEASAVRACGAAGLAVSSGLFHGGAVEANHARYATAWAAAVPDLFQNT